jgi:hypothetical protein
MKPVPTVVSHLCDIRTTGYDLQNASRLLERLMDDMPAKVPAELQPFVEQADWLSRQIETYASTIVTAADDAEALASRGAS